jgi:hypothetical protein
MLTPSITTTAVRAQLRREVRRAEIGGEAAQRVRRLGGGQRRLLAREQGGFVELQPGTAGEAERAGIEAAAEQHDLQVAPFGEARAQDVVDHAVAGDIRAVGRAEPGERREERRRLGIHEALRQMVVADWSRACGVTGAHAAAIVCGRGNRADDGAVP